MSLGSLAAYLASAATLLALPGPTILLIVAATATGRSTPAVLGSAAAVAAVAALLASGVYGWLLAVPYAADALALLGALTVARIAWKLLAGARRTSTAAAAPATPRTVFFDAITTTLLNPKIGIAFPALVTAEMRSTSGDAALLAWLFAAVALIVYCATAAVTRFVGSRAAPSPRTSTLLRRAAGVTMFALAMRIAWPTLRRLE